jgi:hypothetical protein
MTDPDLTSLSPTDLLLEYGRWLLRGQDSDQALARADRVGHEILRRLGPPAGDQHG